MTNKVALIIGGNSGVGKKTAQDLTQKNYRILIVGRNEQKGKQVVQQLNQLNSNSQVFFLQADLSTKAAVNDLAKRLADLVDHIDVLVSSVGILEETQVLTEEGYDQNFVLNYLAHFWLINALLPLLKKSSQGRILLVGALPIIIRHLKVQVPQPVPSKEGYSGMVITGQALAGRLLLTKKLSKRLQDTKVTVNIFHPGNIPDSDYGSTSSSLFLNLMGSLLAKLSKKNRSIGAQQPILNLPKQVVNSLMNRVNLSHFRANFLKKWLINGGLLVKAYKSSYDKI
ncbi:SDR family NAD(P)-dependent oxidoreductase [Candidatus Enterococcus clewellii]|uniref:Uncharacterized protein n=2 Tax=Candidatus Enterococcus clewellii TaxID=1834193 RepID=A0AAQ3XXZ6_9ENTE